MWEIRRMIPPLLIYNSKIDPKYSLVVMIFVSPPDNNYIWRPELTPVPDDFHTMLPSKLTSLTPYN